MMQKIKTLAFGGVNLNIKVYNVSALWDLFDEEGERVSLGNR